MRKLINSAILVLSKSNNKDTKQATYLGNLKLSEFNNAAAPAKNDGPDLPF